MAPAAVDTHDGAFEVPQSIRPKTRAISAGVIAFRSYNWLLVIPVGFVSTAIWWSSWRKQLGYDPSTILAVKYGSSGASAA